LNLRFEIIRVSYSHYILVRVVFKYMYLVLNIVFLWELCVSFSLLILPIVESCILYIFSSNRNVKTPISIEIYKYYE